MMSSRISTARLCRITTTKGRRKSFCKQGEVPGRREGRGQQVAVICLICVYQLLLLLALPAG
jgi:hypothetical protein